MTAACITRRFNTTPPARRAGECRYCGCTDQEACISYTSDPRADDGLRPTGTCHWVEDDLCSRCHGPDAPTRHQEGELARIRSRVGPYRLERAAIDGDLNITLLEPAPFNVLERAGLGRDWIAKRTIVIDPRGRPR